MKSAETITQWDKFRRRLTKQFCTTGTQGISRTILSWQCLGTDNHSSTWWKILGSRDQKQPSTKALSQTINTSVFLILEVLCFIISAPRPYRKVPKASAPGCYSLFQECSSSLLEGLYDHPRPVLNITVFYPLSTCHLVSCFPSLRTLLFSRRKPEL